MRTAGCSERAQARSAGPGAALLEQAAYVCVRRPPGGDAGRPQEREGGWRRLLQVRTGGWVPPVVALHPRSALRLPSYHTPITLRVQRGTSARACAKRQREPKARAPTSTCLQRVRSCAFTQRTCGIYLTTAVNPGASSADGLSDYSPCSLYLSIAGWPLGARLPRRRRRR